MIITIGGQYGCGGKRIAETAAQLLDCTLCDDQLVAQAVQHNTEDLKAETFRYFDESVGTAPIRELSRLSSAQANFRMAVTSLSLDTLPLDRRMENVMSELFHSLADQGSCIFLGRCADYFLRDRADRISVFVIDDLPARTTRIMETFQVEEAEARKLIRKTDKRRSDFYSFFTSRTWGSMDNYDLVLRCSLLGEDGCAQLLAQLARLKTNPA